MSYDEPYGADSRRASARRPRRGGSRGACPRVVRLVELLQAVARVRDVDEVEGAAQARHVDPLLVVGGRVDVRPAHRGAEADRALAPASEQAG